MKSFFCLLFFFTFLATSAQAQEVEVIKYPDLEKIMQEEKGKIKVINFWATWCRPCIKEIPYFESLQEQFPKEELQVYLISFDNVENLEKRVKPFIEKRGIKSTVKLLDEIDYNAFIDKVDPRWSGAIPVTLVISGDQRRFVEGEVSESELKALVKEVNQ